MPGSNSQQILRSAVRFFSPSHLSPSGFLGDKSGRKMLHSPSPDLLLRNVVIFASFAVFHKKKERDTQTEY